MRKLIDEIKNHIELKIKSYKLGTVEKLAVLMSKGLALVAFILLLGFAGLLFTIALTLLLAKLIGSLIIASAIMGAVFLLVALLFFFLRDTIFLNTMVHTLCRLMFRETEYDDGKPAEDYMTEVDFEFEEEEDDYGKE